MPNPTLKPGDFERNQPYRPQLGFKPNSGYRPRSSYNTMPMQRLTRFEMIN